MKRNDIATATHDTAATITAIVPPTVPAVDSKVAPPRTAAAGNAPFSNFLSSVDAPAVGYKSMMGWP
jgi:hypothetical protein